MKAFTGVPTDSRFRNTLTAGVATENAANVAMCSEGDHRSDLFLAGCADNCAFYSNQTGLVSAQ